MALTLHLLRHAAHGHPADMLCGRLAGVRLSVDGQRQAMLLARRYVHGSIDVLYTSPVQRCRETATFLESACGVPARSEPAAEEVDFGEWTGRRFGELEHDARWHGWNTDRDGGAAPGGETMERVRARVVGMLEQMLPLHPHGQVAVVTHAEIVRTAVLHVLRLPLQAYERLEISPASITTLRLWSGGGRLMGLNDVSHLHAQATTRKVEAA